MSVPGESHFVSALGKRRRRYERPAAFDIDRFVADLFARSGVRHWGILRNALHDDLRAFPPMDYPDAVRRVFAFNAREHGKQRYADKTPNYVLSIGRLARLLPEARFVHVIRDGRDVSMSYLEMPWGPTTLEESAVLWRRAVLRGRRAGHRLGAGRYHEVRYEALVARPEATVRELCRFLDVEYDPVMLTFHHNADQIVSGLRHPETREGLRRPPTTNLRNWRTAMSARDAALFDVWAGDLLEELGYERTASRPCLSLRREARVRWLRVQVRRSASRSAALVTRR